MAEDYGEYNYHIEQVKFHHGKKKQHIQKAIEELIINSYPIEKISTKLKKDLENYVSADYIQEICASAGATRPYNSKEELVEVVNADGTVSYVDSDGAPADPVSPKTQNSRPADWQPYEEENRIYIDHIERNISLQKEIVSKLKSVPFISKIKGEARKELDEFLYCSSQIMDMTREAWDDRQKIPTFTQVHLARICIDESNHHSAFVYISKVKELLSISAKQIGKTLRGIIRDVDFRYEPNTEESARENGFYGKPCTQCKNYRVKYEFGWLHCYHCEHDEQARPEKLPKGGLPENAMTEEEYNAKVARGEVN